ncbi:breast cancer type 2 susceptibility protein isoform X3 [Clarias gariepinus]|uniref:breast cancer type 2 susceptibility protein isoform X3 n=1 Tax=Clarias gariepinus TaxID=13013 RepID=UPI00234DB3D3|nr:breast cancer type 2 susceptibility protein isoform X3 [Clarias gariepinus]
MFLLFYLFCLIEELGPLNPDWFEELTLRAFEAGCNNSNVVEDETSAHKDEGAFRAPAKTPVLDSQMCSTPRIFRRGQQHSPASCLEDSLDSGMQNLFPVPPGAESSPCLFGLAKGSEQFEKGWGSLNTNLLDTPTDLKTQASSAQRICESLGAQLNPDLSWSSSFNTPSALTPTVILSKREDQSPPVSFLRDKEVIIVRKLFPSLSKGTDASSAQHNDESFQADEQKSNSSFENKDGVWKQTVPDAITDGAVRNTVESVLHGSEDVLSFFFTNSGSALRRVKTQERKKRVNGVSKDVKSRDNLVALDHTTDCTPASKTDTNAGVAILKSPLFTSQLDEKDFSQWTPLSLSDVHDPKTNQVCVSELQSKLAGPQVHSSAGNDVCNKYIAQSFSHASEQQRASPDQCLEKSQGRNSFLETSPALTFSRKTRKFVYRVQNTLKSERINSVTDDVAEKPNQDSSQCHREEATDTRDCSETTIKSLNLDPDLDMTQLCCAFEEDFTQELNMSKPPHEIRQTSRISMPVCSTTELSKTQLKTEPAIQSEGHVDHLVDEGISLTDIQSIESTVRNSGCTIGFSKETQSCAGTEHLNYGFKTASNKPIVVAPEALEKAKAALDESVEPTTHTGATTAGTMRCDSDKPEKTLSESHHPGHDAVKSEAVAEDVPDTFAWETNESGFKTASNKSIAISTANLEKAKDFFTQLDEAKSDTRLSYNCDSKKSWKSSQRSNGHEEDRGSSTLTASQRADVTELCSMLEEAGSQYEFTQFNHTKMSSKCPESVQLEREFDPEILDGIDFDDSFNCDLADKQLTKKHPAKSILNGLTSIQDINVKNPSCANPSEIPDDDSVQRKTFQSGFKTAKGNAVIVSEKCLSKAKSLFADIEDGDGNVGLESDTAKQEKNQSGDHQNKSCRMTVESDPELNTRLNLVCNGKANSVTKEANTTNDRVNLEILQGDLIPSNAVNFGFTTAGGKEVKISEKALENAKKLLNEAANEKDSGKNSVSRTPVRNPSHAMAEVLHDSKTSDISLPRDGKEKGPEVKQAAFPAPRSVESNGFQTANGKMVSVSVSAIKKTKTIFGVVQDGSRRADATDPKEEPARLNFGGDVGQHAFANGFKTASGKGVSFSEKAFMKAKTFFESCDPDCVDILRVKGDGASKMDDHGFEVGVRNVPRSPGTDLLNREEFKRDSTDRNEYVKRKFSKTSGETLQPQGFSTAGGATVSVSARVLNRATAMLDDLNATPSGEKRLRISEGKTISEDKTDISEKPCGFSTASGRKVAVSEKALEKAKSLFTDCDVDGLGPDPGHLSAPKTSGAGPENTRSTVNIASSKHVTGSEKEVTGKGKDLFVTRDVASINLVQTRQNSSESLGYNKECVQADAEKSEASYKKMDKDLGSGNPGFSTASGKGVCVSKSALKVAFELFRDCNVEPVTNDQDQIITNGANLNKTLVVPKATDASPSLASQATCHDPPLLGHHSLNLDGCTVTQQRYFEQEAMACTKALLEDDLNENGLSGSDAIRKPSPTVTQETCSEVRMGMRKRTSDGKSLTGQPPLKRRLVSEFEQISEDRTANAPVKCSPNGSLKDRRVFKYNLKPNITCPSRNVEGPTPANPGHLKSRPSDLRAPVFIPPFRNNPKSETPKSCFPVTAAHVPSTFVPPVTKKEASGSVSVTDSSQSSGDSAGTTTSRIHSAEKPEDQKLTTDTIREETLENHTTLPPESNVIWQQTLELAKDMQNMRIRKKTRQRVRPLPGSFYLAKTSGVSRVSLKEAVGHKCPELHTEEQLYQHGVPFKVSQITSENAESFQFSCDEFFKREVLRENGGVQLADGGWLIPDNRGMLGKDEFYRALCDTPGVDPKLISEAWVYNHYRWVVWKRASMERAFSEVMGGRCLTPEQVLLQLKLRYDVEVDHSRRSALKKIMERDDTPAKTMVLCVCGIAKRDDNPVRTEGAVDATDQKSESPVAILWLTDGWYQIKALLDLPLTTMLRKGRLRAGTKLVIHGAELIGSQDACPPLEAPDSLMLKISANSTRRARWDTKLGFHKDPRPFPLLLSSVFATGGAVSCVDIVVLRSYPTQWMEKKPGSVFVFRNERAEDREAARYNSTKQKTMELLFSKIQAQIEKEEEEKKNGKRSRTFSLNEIKSLQEGEELHDALESDPALVEAHLSTQQVKAVSSYRRELTEKKRAELQDRVHKAVQEVEGGCAPRDVTPVWKLSIADSNDLHSSRVYTLNIWRPSVELRSLLREGCRYKAYHLATSASKKRSDISNIQFTATKKTQFQDIEVCPEWLSLHFPARQSVKFRDLKSPGFSSPCGEVDIVGYVISILEKQGPSPVLYIVDEKFDFISVRICSSLAVLALEDVVKPLALLAVSNLQLRQQSGPVPGLYAGEQALFSTSPKEAHLLEDISRLKKFVEDYEHFFIAAEEKLSNLIPTFFLNSCESPRTPGLTSAPKPNDRNNVTPHQTSRLFSPFTPVTKQTPVPTGNSDTKDPRSVKRKRGMEYLTRLQNPAPLVPLGMVRSPRVSKTFNPPRRREAPHNPQAERTNTNTTR